MAWILVLGLVGCGESRTKDEDAEITFDASRVDADAGTVPDGQTNPAVCGDSRLSPMEQCDDGNTADGDGCDSMCRREMFCGDNMVDPGEVCDDGDNGSGDGCRSDCLSDESCGNGLLDVAAGEQCDDGNMAPNDGCGSDCSVEASCGDNTLGPTEQCDDGNMMSWDGCGADCREERILVINSLLLGMADEGCDYSGDGVADNSLSSALGAAVSLLNDQFLRDAVTNGDLTLLLDFIGLDDPAGASDPDLTVGFLQGELGPNPGEYLVDPAALDGAGNPVAGFVSSISMNALAGGPEDINIPLGFLPLELRQSRVTGTTTATAGQLDGITGGILCGAVPISTLALLPNILDMFGGMGAPACDGAGDSGSFADLIVGGANVLGFLMIGPVQPDVDLDGDGLEFFEVTSMGPAGCQPVITACIDGDGTRIEGRGCASDSRIVDGFSAGLPFTATGANVVGVSGAISDPVPPPPVDGGMPDAGADAGT
ncbi:MAG: DUF4215 domain-containing protein [Myxococcota bacterium]